MIGTPDTGAPGGRPPHTGAAAPQAPQSELSRHRWRLLSLTSIGAFMGPLDSTIVSVALPKMGKSLNLSYSEALWVQAGYLLLLAICLIPIGRLADARGRMRFYLGGTAAFGIFSMVCAAAPNGTFLIVARCFQAMGAACLVATSAALVTAVFPPAERGRAIGLNVMATYIGLTAGPGIGGLIVSHASWHWIFFINAPIAIATIANGWFLLGAENRDRKVGLTGGPPAGGPPAAAPAAASGAAMSGAAWPAGAAAATAGSAPVSASGAPEAVVSPSGAVVPGGAPPSGPPAASGRIDWLGTSLLGVGLALLLVPLTLVPFWGWASGRTIGLLVAAVVCIAGFVFVEGRVAFPVLDLNLVRKNHAFAAGTFAALLNYAGVFAIGLLTSVFLQIVEGYSPQRAGVLLLVHSGLMAVLSPQFGRLSDKVGSRVLASGGMVFCALGLLQLALLPSGVHPLRVVGALATVGLGMSMFSAPNTSAVMGSVKRHQLSLASGFLGTMRSLGQAVSLGLLGAIAASGLGAVGARVIFLGEAASHAAADAFASGYQTAMFVAVGLCVVGALVSLVRGAPSEPAGRPEGPPA